MNTSDFIRKERCIYLQKLVLTGWLTLTYKIKSEKKTVGFIGDSVNSITYKALEQAGYTISEVDMFGQKHYTRGDVEFKIWNISQSNSSVRIEVETNWQSCHADN